MCKLYWGPKRPASDGFWNPSLVLGLRSKMQDPLMLVSSLVGPTLSVKPKVDPIVP